MRNAAGFHAALPLLAHGLGFLDNFHQIGVRSLRHPGSACIEHRITHDCRLVFSYIMSEPEMNDTQMNPLAQKTVTKMNGIGNEIVILDLRGSGLSVSAEEVRAIGRGEGLGFDQLMVLFDARAADTDAFMKIYNIDGSESATCGNGTRCVAWWALRGTNRDHLILETAAARLACKRKGETSFAVDMGQPHFAWDEIPLSGPLPDTDNVVLEIAAPVPLPLAALVSMGNPHAVFFLSDPAGFDLAKLGPLLEHHPIFPHRANISFAQVLSPEHIILNVWERGTGLTQACGSAACATLVAAVRRGLAARSARITLPGGDLHIAWRESDNEVEMTGPVAFEYEKILDPLLFAGIAA
jgi:diaminopimelate epimerase